MSKIKAISAIFGLLLATGAVLGLGGNTIRSVAGTAGLEKRISVVEDDQQRHKIEVRMEKIQERMWDMERYWAEQFAKPVPQGFGRRHDTLDELIHFMTEVDRKQYRDLQREYDKLDKELEKLDKGDE